MVWHTGYIRLLLAGVTFLLIGCCACPAEKPDAGFFGRHVPVVSGAAAPLDTVTGKPMQRPTSPQP